MRQYLIAMFIIAAPIVAQAADCPADLSALKPHLASPLPSYALPPTLTVRPEALTMAVESRKVMQETIEDDNQHKLTFKGIYAVNDAKTAELKQEIDVLNYMIEIERILRCKLGK